MMTAARAAGRINMYKKRAAANQTPLKKTKRVGSQASVGSDGEVSARRDSSVGSCKRDSLAVPDPQPLRKRSGSVPAIKMVTLASEWNLKPPHVRALKMTWSRLCEPPRSHCKGIVALVERVWSKIDSKDATIKEIFYKAAFVDSMQRRSNPDPTQERCERRRSQNSIATLRDHTHFFVSLTSQLIQNLENDPGDMFAHLDKIGRNHAYLKQYGFKSTHWEKIGEYFIDMVVIQDCVRAYPDACRAWTLLVAAMVDRLRAAPRRGSVATLAVRGSKEELNVAPVRIFGSGNIFCPNPRTPRECMGNEESASNLFTHSHALRSDFSLSTVSSGSMADIYNGARRSSNGEIKIDLPRRNSGGELSAAMDTLKICDSPKSERSSSAEVRRRSFCKLEDVAESLLERKNGISSIDISSKCPLAALRGTLTETKSSSALA